MIRFRFFRMVLLLGFFLPALNAAEYSEGSVKLALMEGSGRFSLYASNAGSRTGYEPLFADQDLRTSFLSVMVNDRSYKLGDTSTFKIRLGTDPDRPSLIFESPFLLVTEEFSFIKTEGSQDTNGVSLTITLENRGDPSALGARLLLDTSLGEGGRQPPFTTSGRSIESETLIEKGSPESWWFSGGSGLFLMGSIFNSAGDGPDSVHFANWKRLNDVPWKAPYAAGRNFNAPPYSVGDSAVCYYFEPRLLARRERRSFTVTLAAWRGPALPQVTAIGPSDAVQGDERQQDLALIRQLIATIDGCLAAGGASEEELASMEQTLRRLMNKYGFSPPSQQ
ncbi:MAG: hypothetical protein LBS48_07205 [Treponema sp.]|jgi:hypothetical protein|nr:hypothetical protein [Treponema sp.]